MIIGGKKFSSFVKKVQFLKKEDYLMKDILNSNEIGGKVEK